MLSSAFSFPKPPVATKEWEVNFAETHVPYEKFRARFGSKHQIATYIYIFFCSICSEHISTVLPFENTPTCRPVCWQWSSRVIDYFRFDILGFFSISLSLLEKEHIAFLQCHRTCLPLRWLYSTSFHSGMTANSLLFSKYQGKLLELHPRKHKGQKQHQNKTVARTHWLGCLNRNAALSAGHQK